MLPIDEKTFKSELLRAATLRKLETDCLKSDYWAGYERGLRRAYHGVKFGTAQEHILWLDLVNSQDESRKQRGAGYRDGLARRKK